MLILVVNALAYVIWFLIAYWQEKKLTLYTCMIGLIAIVASLGVYTMYADIWFNTFGYYDTNTLDFEPYLLTFIGFFILFSPLKGLDSRIQLSNNVFESKSFKYFLIIWFGVIVTYTLVRLTEMFIAISIGLNEVYKERHVLGNDLMFMQYGSPIIGKIIWLMSIISNTTSPVMMFYSIYLINKEKKIMPLIILALAVIPDIIYAVALGSRGSMVWGFFKLIFIFVLMKDHMSKEIRKMVLIIVSGALLLVLINAIITTAGRVENTKNESSAVNSILRYFGEPFPNAGFLYWNQVKAHPMGDRFFPDYVGFHEDIGVSSDEKFDYWSSVTSVPILNWKIFYIDCYIEFGIFGALIFICFLNLLFRFIFRDNPITVYNISILYAYFTICDSSFTGYNMFSQQINATIISILIMNYFMFVIRKRDDDEMDNIDTPLLEEKCFLL